MDERNRQTGRTTTLLHYALSQRAIYVVHNESAVYNTRTLTTKNNHTLIVSPATLELRWRELGKPLIMVDHCVWEFCGPEQLTRVKEILAEATIWAYQGAPR